MMECHSARTRNKIVLSAETQTDPEIIVQSDVGHKEKNKCGMILLICRT